MIIPWGKYSGEDIDDIPNTYLEWIYDNMIVRNESDRAIYRAVTQEIQDREESGIYISGDFD